MLLYGEALGLDEDNEPLTTSWVYMMENNNDVPVDKKRRWIIAQLLSILPFLFGLETLSEVATPPKKTAFDKLLSEKVDVGEYRARLASYSNSWLTGKVQRVIPNMQWRILHLQSSILGTTSSEKKQIIRLLCEYYTLLAKLTAQQSQDFDQAIALLSKAISVAETNNLYDIWAYALRQRGIVYSDRGELTAGLADFTSARHDFDAAIGDFLAAQRLQPHLSPQYKRIVYLGAGRASSFVAQDQRELGAALKLFEIGGKTTGNDEDDMKLSTEFNAVKYHLDLGKALIASPVQSLRSPAAAREEFEQALQLTPPTLKLRYALLHIRLAETYYLERSYPMVTAYTEQALKFMQGVDSKQNLTLLDNLHQRLQESPFGKSAEVASLGIKLLKIQQPTIFT